MNYIDIILLIPLIWMGYRGFRHGFVIELASLVGFVAGIYAAIQYSESIGHFLVSFFDAESKYLPVIAFIIVFIVVVVFVYLLGKILENFINMIALGFLNKIAGGIFGVLKAALFISFIILIFTHLSIDLLSEEKKEKSVLYSKMSKLAPYIWKKFGDEGLFESGKRDVHDIDKTEEV
jgi:membrane protein required for colicin V production